MGVGTCGKCRPALQVAARLLDYADMLHGLFADAPTRLAAVLAGSNLPSVALQLAARLERANNANAAEKVGPVSATI